MSKSKAEKARMSRVIKPANSMQFRFPTMYTWVKLLLRWSDFPMCGEKRLLCNVIAQAIVYQHDRGNMEPVASASGFWGAQLEKYCGWLNMSAVYVREQVLVAARRDGEIVEISK